MGKEFLPGVIDFGQNLGFSYQHAIKVLDNHNLMMYDNGNHNNPEVSRCIEIEINEDTSNAQIVWEYILPDSVFTASMGECDRLENGNTLITAGRANYLLEIDNAENVVWEVNTGDPFYRSERLPNLYPLFFSVQIPNFTNIISSSIFPVVYLPLGESIFELTITNKGYLDFDFSYQMNDNLNWSNQSGIINIPSNSNFTIGIPININSSAIDNIIEISVCPISEYEVNCKTIILNANTCSTNPNYYFSDMSTCPELVYGDINQDGILDILDVVLTVNMVMDFEYNELADINEDGIVDILDIVMMVNIIMNQ